MRELQRIFAALPASLRWRWFALLPLILLSAVIEAIGAAAVFALLRVLTDPSTVSALPFASRLGLLTNGSASAVTSITLVVMAVYAVRLVVLGGVTEARDYIGFRSIVRLSDDLLNGYLHGSLAAGGARGTAEMMFRIERGTAIAVVLGLASATQLVAEVCVALGLVALLAITAPLTTFLAVFVTAGLLLLPAAFSRTLFARWGKQEERAEVRLRQQLRDGFGALREIKVYGREQFFRGRVTRASSHLAHFRRRQGVGKEVVRLTVETIFVMVLLAMVGALTWLSDGNDVVPVMGLYAFAGFRFVPSANRITLYINNINSARPVIRDLGVDFDVIGRETRADADAPGVLPFKSHIRFENITFQYPGGTRPALQDVNLTIRKGESVGIVGPSGAGKSTLVDVLLALLDPSSGRLTVDDQDVAEVHRAWQRNIGYVAQSFYLLDDTLRCNIAFGLEPDAIDEGRLREVVRAARLDELVTSLPKGLDTPIGEAGTRLSGGERQRVAIARALYAQPSVLVLDEATAALDPLTEREVTDAIAAFRGRITMIVIAHRMSTVRGCDRLVMLRDGRVHATGPYDELLESDEDFRALVTGDAQTG